MCTLEWIDLTCPVCARTFETIAPVPNAPDAGEAAGTPLRQTTAELLPFLVHVCRKCGYAAEVDQFDDGVIITRDVRARVWAELAPTLAPSVRIPALLLMAPGSEKHEAAAKVAEWRGLSTLTIAELWIRAARCAVDEGDFEAERYYARFAARWFEEALDRDEVDPLDRESIVCGLGQLWLHLGDVRTAMVWFNRAWDGR